MYNDKFIGLFSDKMYLKCLKDVDSLNYLADEYLKKYQDGELVNGVVLAFKESLDHYVVKSILHNKDKIDTFEFKNYYNYIKKICNSFPIEEQTNILFRLNDNYLQEIFSIMEPDNKNTFTVYNQNKININNKINKLNNKIKNNELVTQNELNFLCSYYAGRRLYDINYSNLITYIFTKLSSNNNLLCSYQVLDAICTFLPFEFSPESINECIDASKFNAHDIRIYFTDVLNKQKWNSPGISTGSSLIVFINREMFKNINFDSIDNSKKDYLKRGKDFTFMMIVAFHELTHQLQKSKIKASNITEQGYMYITKTILNKELCDYSINHDNDDVEINATEVGWEECEKFYSKHYNREDKKELMNKCYINSHSTKTRYGTSIKEVQNGKLIEKDMYDIMNLTRIIKNNPNILKKYPSLKNLYNQDGEINDNILFYDNFGYTRVGKKYLLYLLRTKQFNKIRVSSLPIDKQGKLIRNLYQAVHEHYKILDLINYTTNHDTEGEYEQKISKEKANNLVLKNMFEDFYLTLCFMMPMLNNSILQEEVAFYIKSLRNDLLKQFSKKVRLVTGMQGIDIEEQVQILNQLIKEARNLNVSYSCINYFNIYRNRLINDEKIGIRNKKTVI